MQIHIAFVDDHTLVREGFKGIVQLDENIKIDFECDTFDKAVEYLGRKPVLDVFIVDISLGKNSGFQLIKLASQSGIKCLVVSMHDREPYISEAMRAGAIGYISKASAASVLLSGIKAVNEGKIYYSSDIKVYLADSAETNPLTTLTTREIDVCRQLVKGIEIKKIAFNLGISPKTVYVHKSNAFEKLNIASVEDLFRLAREFGLSS
jgi:DNA-binding NarL/FixJ family response regulator